MSVQAAVPVQPIYPAYGGGVRSPFAWDPPGLGLRLRVSQPMRLSRSGAFSVVAVKFCPDDSASHSLVLVEQGRQAS